MAELIETLQKVGYNVLGNRARAYTDSDSQELVNIDNDVKGKFTQYKSVQSNLATLQRKQK